MKPLANKIIRLCCFSSLFWLTMMPIFAWAQEQQEQQELPSQNNDNSQESTADSQGEGAAQAEQEKLLAEVRRRQEAIATLESELGVYDPALSEAYGDLASIYEQLEDRAAAVDTYGNALQITRIANGLDSTEQLHLIERLIANNDALKAWVEVDDLQQLSYHVNLRNYSLEDAAYLENVNQYVNWKRRLLRENLLQLSSAGRRQTVIDLSNFYEHKVAQFDEAQINPSRGLLEFHFGRAAVDVQYAREIARLPIDYFQGTANPYIRETRCFMAPNDAGVLVRQCRVVQRKNPRYASSQRDAKRFELMRSSAAVRQSLDRVVGIAGLLDLSGDEKASLESELRAIDTELQALLGVANRNSRLINGSLF